ncbi:MAG: hypothetical protein AAGJ70_01395 [Pseudomonadota bacterium]
MFSQHQIEITRRTLLGRLADRIRPRKRDMRGSERQQTWSFMLWSFVLVHVLDKFGIFSNAAHAASDDVDASDDQGAGAVAADGDTIAADDTDNAGNDEAVRAENTNDDAADDLDLDASDLDDGDDDAFDSAGGAGNDLNAPSVVAAGSIGSAAPLGNLTTDFAPLPAIENLPPIPDLDFFDGFSDFATDLGFGEGGAEFLGLLDAGVQSNVGIALSFVQNPIVAVDVWKSLGNLQQTVEPNGNDSFDIEWTIQLNGVIGDHVFQAESTSDALGESETTATFQHADTSASLQGNSAILIDGEDWDDLLWVQGNYYEFNTIVQVNVLWDNDIITAEFEGEAADHDSALGEIHSGGNQQHNAAVISDVLPAGMETASSDAREMTAGEETASEAVSPQTDVPQVAAEQTPAVEDPPVDDAIILSGDPYDALIEQACCEAGPPPPTQLILGDQVSHNAVVQQNSVVDLDVLNYDLQDLVDGLGIFDIEDQFADVFGSGHEQHNDVQIVQEQTNYAADWTAQSFAAAHQTTAITTVSGDYYEFNTIIQINIIEDSQELIWSGTSGASALSSGGNMQFNTAALLHNDAQDELFVNGNYTEYNLVLQVNAIEDNDTIGQTSALTHTGSQSASDGIGNEASDGASGLAGESDTSSPFDFHVPDFTVDTSALPGYA